MNHMARQQAVQRAPEIIVVNDGKPVENVGSAGKGAMIAKLVVPAVAALVVGVGIGRISRDANFYNDGISDAKVVLGDQTNPAPSTLRATKKTLAELDTKLEEIKTRSKFKYDEKGTKDLAELLKKLEVNAELIFRAKQNALDPMLSQKIISFYAGVTEIRAMLDQHLKSAKADDQSLKTGAAKEGEATPSDTKDAALAQLSTRFGLTRYAILTTAPTACELDDKGEKKDKKCDSENDDFGARVVEIGPPYCDGKLETSGKCANNAQPDGFGWRMDPGSNVWYKGDLVLSGSDNVPANKSAAAGPTLPPKKLIPLLPSGVRDAMIKSAEPGASEVFYTKRLQALLLRTKAVIEIGNQAQTGLEGYVNKGTRFSFFL